MKDPNNVEPCSSASTPCVIPETVLRLLTDLDSDKSQPNHSWTIQKDRHGLTITLKFTKSRTCSQQRNTVKTVPGTSELVHNSSDVIITKRKKYKSPSTIRRNRQRRKAWLQRQKSLRLLTRSSRAHAAEDNSPKTAHNDTDSEPSLATTPSHDELSNTSEHELETEQLCTNSVTCEIAQTDTNNFLSDLSASKSPEFEWGNLCAYCKVASKDDDQFKRCTGCKFVRYCSKSCQATHWKVHKPACKILQAGPDCVT